MNSNFFKNRLNKRVKDQTKVSPIKIDKVIIFKRK